MLQFNQERFIKDLSSVLSSELTIVSDTLIQKMAYAIDAIPYSGSIAAVGKPNWRQDVINSLNYRIAVTTNDILVDIGVLDQSDNTIMKAMIIEFGMGVSMDTNNPWLSDYFGSDYYHDERGGLSVYGRKGKQVYDIDSGSWKPSTAKHDKEIKHFRQKGSHFWTDVFGENAEFALSHINAAIERATDSLDFSKYVDTR